LALGGALKKKYNIDIDTDVTGFAGRFASLKKSGLIDRVSQQETEPV